MALHMITGLGGGDLLLKRVLMFDVNICSLSSEYCVSIILMVLFCFIN